MDVFYDIPVDQGEKPMDNHQKALPLVVSHQDGVPTKIVDDDRIINNSRWFIIGLLYGTITIFIIQSLITRSWFDSFSVIECSYIAFMIGLSTMLYIIFPGIKTPNKDNYGWSAIGFYTTYLLFLLYKYLFG